MPPAERCFCAEMRCGEEDCAGAVSERSIVLKNGRRIAFFGTRSAVRQDRTDFSFSPNTLLRVRR